jgi:phosphoribosylformylglycinamidine synthase
LTDAIIEAATAGKYVLGICNGAQILLEAGLVPGTGPVRRPTAAFAPNRDGGRFICRRVHVRLACEPHRLPVLADLAPGAVIPMWVAHGDGRLAAAAEELDRLDRDGHVAFVYSDAAGGSVAAPQGSALACAGLSNRAGTVLAIMPHPERDAVMLPSSGGSIVLRAFARALDRVVALR